MACKTGETNHRDVDDKKEHKETRIEEMNGPRRLLTVEHADEGGEYGGDGGRHGEAGPDHQRKQNENHRQVRESLKDVIGQGFFARGPLQVQMIRNDARDAAPGEIRLGW